MLEGVERLVDLVGVRATALTGATPADVADAVARGDVDRLAATDGHFAAVGREERTVRLSRTIGQPLRYFVAKMYHGPFLVVADRMDRMFDWCQEQRIGWQFDPIYTRMVPAHYLIEIDQVGCPDPMPRYRRFFNPPIAQGPADIEAAGAAYMQAAYESLRSWIARVPADQPIGVAFSGGIDSTATFVLAQRVLADLGRSPLHLRAFTLDLGGGIDARQARATLAALGCEAQLEVITASPTDVDLEEAIRTIEDYHPLDVECAATALVLLRVIRDRYPSLRYLIDGDGGDENLKSYPLEDSDLTLSSILRNPLLYQEGWGVDAIKHSVVYSGGLSRGYVRTCAPAAAYGFEAFSPFSVRSVIAAAAAIPFEQVLEGSVERLYALKRDVVTAGIRSITGIDMPANPKRRFQDGALATPRTRVAKAWCRQVFNRIWENRLREANDNLSERRSGNEMTV
ncbi:MAG TPA: asparagine synthase C-terminal domain-containing protein [Vicinamibacterales bacterium]|nr:asparagine synthase C-terminal domain-containing protein [Vicinamibacterales bacterium]